MDLVGAQAGDFRCNFDIWGKKRRENGNNGFFIFDYDIPSL